ncbi:MAG: MCE family protein [Actinomycetota bacterium]|nr:MCE family protein [Actinomycetota bacterium]
MRLPSGLPFRERDPRPIGAIGIAVLALLVVLAFNVQKLPFIGGGDTYHAAFAEAGGLKSGDPVRIAGVTVGKVTGVDLENAHVMITFTVRGSTRLGIRTEAAVKLQTLLGKKFLQLTPAGPGRLSGSGEIPLSRTTSSYDVVDAFSDLTTTTEQIDSDQLAKSLATLSTEFKDSPADVKASLDGLSRLSHTVASRNDALRELLSRANAVTGTVASRNGQVASLIQNGDLLLQELSARREAIHTLFLNTARLAQQLTGLVQDNRAQLGPALAQLHQVLTTLQRQEDSLSKGVRTLAPFTRVFANALGNGPWFDACVPNLVVPAVTPGLPSAGCPGGGAR